MKSESESGENSATTNSQYTKDGLALWLNNQPDQSQEYFKAKLDKTPIFAGYTFTFCMNGVISYEMDKIDEAHVMLKELERRCTSNVGWLAAVRTKIFGGTICTKPLSQSLEEQIILADTILSSAILTFLTQDITGLMKGSWLLRKAWKIYQTTYHQLFDLFMKHFADEPNAPPVPPNYSRPIARSASHYNWIDSGRLNRRSSRFGSNNFPPNSENINPTAIPSIVIIENGKTSKDNNENEALLCDKQQQQQQQHLTETNAMVSSEHSLNRPLTEPTNNYPSKSSLNLDLNIDIAPSSRINGTFYQVPLTCPNPPKNSRLGFGQHPQVEEIDPETVKRLMGAVSFGYGIFQLSASLLPMNLLRIISFFGFEGNRKMGIECLMYSRLSSDMRAPLATLALLWFYTFGSQMFQHEDGYSLNEIKAASNLLTENLSEYGNSAIFLFFKGRVERMKANSAAAVGAYETAYRFSPQKELKLLCLHEIAWCKLIQLNFENAMLRFNELREISVYSKAFYTYLTAICQGASGHYDNLVYFKSEIVSILSTIKQKDTQISRFVERRIKIFPTDDIQRTNLFYWKYLVYEILFLWCALSNVSADDLEIIVSDCSLADDTFTEPMIGIQKLVLGGALVCQKNYENAVVAYRECIQKREQIIDADTHVSVFARYELAMLLLQNSHDYTQDAKKLLQDALTFKNYDLENRLSVHIQKELKRLS